MTPRHQGSKNLLITTIRSLMQQWLCRQNGKEVIGFILGKWQLFVAATWYYFHTPDLWSMWTQHNFFSTLRSNPFRFNQRKLRSMKFETVQNSLFKWSFWFVVIQKFCSHGNMMWRIFLTIEQNTSTVHIAPTQRYLSKREIAHSLRKHLPGCNKIKHINFSDI